MRPESPRPEPHLLAWLAGPLRFNVSAATAENDNPARKLKNPKITDPAVRRLAGQRSGSPRPRAWKRRPFRTFSARATGCPTRLVLTKTIISGAAHQYARIRI